MENHIHSPRQMTLKRAIVVFEVGLFFFFAHLASLQKYFVSVQNKNRRLKQLYMRALIFRLVPRVQNEIQKVHCTLHDHSPYNISKLRHFNRSMKFKTSETKLSKIITLFVFGHHVSLH